MHFNPTKCCVIQNDSLTLYLKTIKEYPNKGVNDVANFKFDP